MPATACSKYPGREPAVIAMVTSLSILRLDDVDGGSRNIGLSDVAVVARPNNRDGARKCVCANYSQFAVLRACVALQRHGAADLNGVLRVLNLSHCVSPVRLVVLIRCV